MNKNQMMPGKLAAWKPIWQKIGHWSVYVLLISMITGGFYVLYPKQAMSQTGAPHDGPTAYLESNEVSASFKMGGRISELLVKEGDVVKKGQVLAKLQSDEIQAKVNQAKAAVGLSEGKIAEAQGAEAAAEAKRQQGQSAVKLTADSAEAQIKQAEAAVTAAQAKVDALNAGARPEEKKQAEIQMNATKEVFQVAETNLNRLQKLFDQGLIAQTEVDKAQVSYQEAKGKYEAAQQQNELASIGPREEEIRGAEAQLDQAKGALELAQANKEQVPVRQGDVNAAAASVNQAQGAVKSAESGQKQASAALDEAQTYLNYTDLVAPVDGIVTQQSAQLGELVGSGFPVFTIQASDEKWARFYLSEKETVALKPGDQVTAKLLSTNEQVQGIVSVVAPAADFAVKKATQNAGDTDLRSFGVKVRFSSLPPNTAAGITLKWGGKLAAKVGTAPSPGKAAGEANAH